MDSQSFQCSLFHLAFLIWVSYLHYVATSGFFSPMKINLGFFHWWNVMNNVKIHLHSEIFPLGLQIRNNCLSLNKTVSRLQRHFFLRWWRIIMAILSLWLQQLGILGSPSYWLTGMWICVFSLVPMLNLSVISWV